MLPDFVIKPNSAPHLDGTIVQILLLAAKGILTETHKDSVPGAERRAGRLDYTEAQGLVKDFVFYLENQEKSLNYSLGKCKIKPQ